MILKVRLNMSNQRPGKKQSRPDILGQDMGILKFFKIAEIYV